MKIQGLFIFKRLDYCFLNLNLRHDGSVLSKMDTGLDANNA